MARINLAVERHFRVAEVAELSGLAVGSIRRKLGRRELGFRKAGRAVLIPASEVQKLLGTYQPALNVGIAR
jgi:excisionase family DNA binding protein